MSKTNSSKNSSVKNALNAMKFETAKEVNVNLKDGYNGDISSKDAGKVGGNMTKKMVEKAEKQMGGTTTGASK